MYIMWSDFCSFLKKNYLFYVFLAGGVFVAVSGFWLWRAGLLSSCSVQASQRGASVATLGL